MIAMAHMIAVVAVVVVAKMLNAIHITLLLATCHLVLALVVM